MQRACLDSGALRIKFTLHEKFTIQNGTLFHSYTFTPLMPQFDANKRFVKAIGKSQSVGQSYISLSSITAV
ncbi:hypothetical protein WN943_006059 [Citrus x changshan-huyou]